MKSSIVVILPALAIACVSAWVGCAAAPPEGEGAVSNIEANDPAYAHIEPVMRTLYPNLDSLYAGEQGIYRGCGPNNGVCHNSREYPNLSTVGSLIENIGLPCNEKREDPREVHDLCERAGDLVRGSSADGEGKEISFIEADPTAPRTFHVHVREKLAPSTKWHVVRPSVSVNGENRILDLLELDEVDIKATLSPDGLVLTVVVPPPYQEPGEEPEEDYFLPLFDHAGRPGDPTTIQVGDPNRNGTFGATLGGKLIVPGDPEKSYLFKRLTDPSAGPVMPRANCCFWTKASLRAMWCWVSGLAEDGSNAQDPIDYDACPAGPPDTMEYPEPGPACETSGMCPLQPKVQLSDEPTWTNVYGAILKPQCSGCHSGAAAAGGLDLGNKDAAFTSLVERSPPRVIPNDPNGSMLFKRINPALCTDGCVTMPKGAPPLEQRMQSVIERWIAAGALKE